MNDTHRDRMLDVLRQLWELAPDQRLGQLVANLAFVARPEATEAVYHVEDDELLLAADEQIRALQTLSNQGALAVKTFNATTTTN